MKPGSIEDNIRLALANTNNETALINMAVEFIHLMKSEKGHISTKFYKDGKTNTDTIFKESENYWKRRIAYMKYKNMHDSVLYDYKR